LLLVGGALLALLLQEGGGLGARLGLTRLVRVRLMFGLNGFVCVCVNPSYHTTHTTKAARSAQEPPRRPRRRRVARRSEVASREKTRPPPVSGGSSPWFVGRMNMTTIRFFTEPLSPIHRSRFSGTLDASPIDF